ncbi:MAG: AIR synthase related protein [Ignavibacteria bacterium]|jgi:selenophosphate synthetase-related protein
MIEEVILEKYNLLKKQNGSDTFKVRQVRDLLITELTDEFWLVIACDSAGGIGPKELDSFYSPAYELGRMVVRVPVMEVLASGAIPIIVVDTLAVEMDPTGKEIIRGVKDESSEAGINSDLAVTGSTEDNVKTAQTGAGTVIIGFVHEKDFRPGNSIEGDIIVSVGIPKSAPEYKVTYADPEIADSRTIRELNKIEFIHDILPVGSKGIKHELSELSKSAGLEAEQFSNIGVDVNKSGGPSTCCLVSLPEEKFELLKERINKPIFLIGKLKGRDK